MFVFDVCMTCVEVIATPWHGFHKNGFTLHVCISYMSHILLRNHFTWIIFYLTWVDAPGMFYASGMFDVSGTKEASKASSKEIRDI